MQVIPLGKTTEVGTPKEVMDRVKKILMAIFL